MKAKKIFAILLALSMTAVLGACSDNSSSSSSTANDNTASVASTADDESAADDANADDNNGAAAPDEDGGFTEIPIDETDVDCAPVHLSAVYFQPVDMQGDGKNDIKSEDYNIHLEADISALENELGFGKGDWIPYLTVDYKIVGSDKSTAAEGTFMVMNADDGPHYGANVKLDKSDTYSVTFTLHSPVENGFLLHVDEETGVKGRFWEDPIEVTFDNWDYTVQDW